MKFNNCKSLLCTLFLMSMTHAKNNNFYYDKKEILAETHWKDVSIQENAPFHLSILSQGRYDENLTPNYDKNYYYPSSAGKDIDVYVFDTGFNFSYDEFSDINANCEIEISSDNSLIKLGSEKVCYNKNHVFDHGTMVSAAIAGKYAGVAKKANIHGILFSDRFEVEDNNYDAGELYIGRIIIGLEYLLNNDLIKPNKTVLNFSNGIYISAEDIKNKEIHKKAQSLFNEISSKGAVIVAGAGNDGVSINHNDIAFYPCAFENVICAGGIGNYFIPGISPQNPEDVAHADEINSSYYQLGNYVDSKLKTNYGEVDLYSSFLFHYNSKFTYDSHSAEKYKLPPTNDTACIEQFDNVVPGTSFSSPLVAGLAATLMSEFPEKEHNSKTMLQNLTELAEEGIIVDLPYTYPNLFVNNGKKIVYDAILPTDIPSEVEDDIISEIENEIEVEDNDNEVEEVDSSYE